MNARLRLSAWMVVPAVLGAGLGLLLRAPAIDAQATCENKECEMGLVCVSNNTTKCVKEGGDPLPTCVTRACDKTKG